MSFVFAQLTALVFRPHPGTRFRPAWALFHQWVGRAATVVGIANVYWGLTKVQLIISNSDWAVAVVSVVFGLIVLTGVAKDLLDYARLTPAARSSAVPFVRHTYPTPPQAHAARKDSEQESGGSSQGGGSSSKAQD